MRTDCHQTVKKVMRAVPGKCSDEAMAYLCELAQSAPPGWMIDLGTYQGRSAMVLQLATLGDGHKRRIISIDNYHEGPNAKDPSAGPPPDVFTVRERFK